MNLKYIIKLLMLSSMFIMISFINNNLLYYIPFIIIHEFTHCITGIKLGYTIKKIGLLPFGIFASFNEEFINPLDDILITASGPLINFIFFILFSLFKDKDIIFMIISQCNLILCIFNLVPAGFLDGGRILSNILKINFSFYIAYYINNINGIILGCLVFFASILVPISYKSIILLLMGIYFIYNGYTSQKAIIINITKDLLNKQAYLVKNKKLKEYDIYLKKDCKLIDVIKHFCFGKNRIIYINIYGISDKIFSEREILKAYLSFGNIMLSKLN